VRIFNDQSLRPEINLHHSSLLPKDYCKYISYPSYHLSFINVHDSLLVMVVVQFRVGGLGVTSMNKYMDQYHSGQPNLK
jgi:hypothetical protein